MITEKSLLRIKDGRLAGTAMALAEHLACKHMSSENLHLFSILCYNLNHQLLKLLFLLRLFIYPGRKRGIAKLVIWNS